MITIAACACTGISGWLLYHASESPCLHLSFTAAGTSSYVLGFPSMTKDLNCTDFQAAIGLSTYALGFGVVPLMTSSFSEEVGRIP
jgi:hypothetical protein